jgi:hypothetical protein
MSESATASYEHNSFSRPSKGMKYEIHDITPECHPECNRKACTEKNLISQQCIIKSQFFNPKHSELIRFYCLSIVNDDSSCLDSDLSPAHI